MFFGEYEHAIDDKSRLTLPARFRAALADGVVLSKGLDGSVDVYPREAWDGESSPGSASSTRSLPDARLLQRHFFGGATEDVPDKQGRVHLPAPLAPRHARQGRHGVGVNDHLEIWDRAAWAAHLEGIEGSADNVAQRLAEQRV